MSKNKYIPPKKLNPAELKIRLDSLSRRLDAQDKALEALSISHDVHISYLGNFARHDIKNCVQSMDSILSTTELNDFTQEHFDSLVTNLDIIRDTLDNFSKLVPYSVDKKFSIHSLITAVELISRSDIYTNKIKFTKHIHGDPNNLCNLPFQSMLQMINNLVINAIKSLENVQSPKIHLSVLLEHEKFVLKISDNGISVPSKMKDKIFEFGYSTTGGSGIGLYHARYLSELFDGKIEVHDEGPSSDFTKTFLIELPLKS